MIFCHGKPGGTWFHKSFCRHYPVPAGVLGLVEGLIRYPQGSWLRYAPPGSLG